MFGSSEEKVTEDKDNKEGKDNKENGHSTIPEGFFDDPIMDAKVTYLPILGFCLPITEPSIKWGNSKLEQLINNLFFRLAMLNIKIPLKKSGRGFKKKLKKKQQS